MRFFKPINSKKSLINPGLGPNITSSLPNNQAAIVKNIMLKIITALRDMKISGMLMFSPANNLMAVVIGDIFAEKLFLEI